MLVAFFVGQQFLNMSSAGAKPTDRLITSEFVQAVEQDRATKVVYNAGDYTVSGSYYPAITAGSTGADAFNEAFQALNARMATLKNPETGKALGGVGTTDINGATLGVERNFTSTYYGGSLGDLMAAHPNVPYEVALPSPFVELLGTLLPFIIIGLILFFFFNQMQKANNSQMSFGKAKTKKSIEERPDVKFSDVAGVDEAVEEMQEIKDFLANPAKYQSMGAKIPRGCLLVGPPGTGKPCSRAPSPVRRACRSQHSGSDSSRCSSAWARLACATCSSRRRMPARPLSSSTRSTLSAASAARASAAATTSASRR